MPAIRQFNRRIAAIGAAFALAALPVSSTITPAFAEPDPTPSAESGAAGTADTEAASSADADDSSGADEGSSDTGSSKNEGSSTDNGVTEVEGETEAGGSSDPDPDYDTACKAPEKDEPVPGTDGPCETDEPLKAKWHPGSKTLTVTKPKNKPGSLPESWVGVAFDNPGRNTVSVPVQSERRSAGDDSTRSAHSDSDTDDSGRSVAEAAAQADAPASFEINSEGEILAEGADEPMKFTSFKSDPKWSFTADGTSITAEGKRYPDDSGGADSDDDGSSSSGSTAGSDDNSNADSELTASKDSNAGDDSSNPSGKTDGSSSDSNTGEDKSSDTDGTSADDGSSSTSDSSRDDNASGAKTTSSDKDADGRNSNSDTGSRAEASGSSDSEGSASDSDSGKDKDKDSGKDNEKDSDKDGSGSTLGTSDANGTTPDPSNGNGSQDGRETIPGTTGDEWLPGDEDSEHQPDYSDPVPRNPDEPAPKDDSDLITGGDQPSPRANQHPATSFGESIISTIVSSWPVFVLAASGMAAVGFIIYLMGRRGKQD
ncbi:hypothetical protein [Brevibacterium sp. FAM 24630]|uniref:hypothetical protein n=1 Tax=Brevibacterium sp. FAM 24630 TaxID=3415680 RepID=UPI003C7AD7F1